MDIDFSVVISCKKWMGAWNYMLLEGNLHKTVTQGTCENKIVCKIIYENKYIWRGCIHMGE